MQVIDNTQREKSTLPGIEHLTVASRAHGLTRLSMWQQSMAPGCATPPHRHDCEEVVLVLEGSGEVQIGDRRFSFGPDTTLVLPPDVPHQIFNTGTVPLKTVAAFSATPVGTFLPQGKRLELPWAT
jgi:mannose-6-phosphate isomerase-like protein (cupin superfamily)